MSRGAVGASAATPRLLTAILHPTTGCRPSVADCEASRVEAGQKVDSVRLRGRAAGVVLPDRYLICP